MKKHRPVKHAHRKAMIAEKKAKGKYSRVDLPKGFWHIVIVLSWCHDCDCDCDCCWADGTHFCP